MRALLVIDMQYDFCDGGPMATFGSFEIIPIINRIRSNFNIVIFTKDWHPENHSSFKKDGGSSNPHCIQNTKGAEIHNNITVQSKDLMVHKGTLQKYQPHSAFYNAKDIGKESNLNELLRINEVDELYICGIGIDDCIFSTVLDCMRFGYKYIIIEDAVSYFNKDNKDKVMTFLNTMNTQFMKSADIGVNIAPNKES